MIHVAWAKRCHHPLLVLRMDPIPPDVSSLDLYTRTQPPWSLIPLPMSMPYSLQISKAANASGSKDSNCQQISRAVCTIAQ